MHGLGIDVVELTSASRAVLTITLSLEIVAHKIVPIAGNSPVFAVGDQRKSVQNFSHGDNIDYLLLHRLILVR